MRRSAFDLSTAPATPVRYDGVPTVPRPLPVVRVGLLLLTLLIVVIVVPPLLLLLLLLVVLVPQKGLRSFYY